MRLKPFDTEETSKINEVTELPPEIQDTLVNSGLAFKSLDTNSKESKLDSARQIFKQNKAGVEDAAKVVSMIMHNAEKDSDRLKAADRVLEVMGILDSIDEKSIPQITINIQGEGNKTLVNLVLPFA